jgi:hypothetical protein
VGVRSSVCYPDSPLVTHRVVKIHAIAAPGRNTSGAAVNQGRVALLKSFNLESDKLRVGVAAMKKREGYKD